MKNLFKNIFLLTVGLVLGGIAGGTITMMLKENGYFGRGLADYRAADRPWIEKALVQEFGSNEIGQREALKAVNPVVVYLDSEVCVGLNVRPSALGSESSICFSRADQTVSRKHIE